MENNSLENKVDKLTEMVRVLGVMVKDMYLTQNGLTVEKIQSNTIQPQTKVKNLDNNLTPKNKINWDEIILGVKDTNSEKFVLSIYNNTYPTVTESQINVLDNIASQLGITLYA